MYLALHGANRPSHEGVVPLYDRAITLCRQAGFTDILLRGDTDFSLTTEFDRWDDDGDVPFSEYRYLFYVTHDWDMADHQSSATPASAATRTT